MKEGILPCGNVVKENRKAKLTHGKVNITHTPQTENIIVDFTSPSRLSGATASFKKTILYHFPRGAVVAFLFYRKRFCRDGVSSLNLRVSQVSLSKSWAIRTSLYALSVNSQTNAFCWWWPITLKLWLRLSHILGNSQISNMRRKKSICVVSLGNHL